MQLPGQLPMTQRHKNAWDFHFCGWFMIPFQYPRRPDTSVQNPSRLVGKVCLKGAKVSCSTLSEKKGTPQSTQRFFLFNDSLSQTILQVSSQRSLLIGFFPVEMDWFPSVRSSTHQTLVWLTLETSGRNHFWRSSMRHLGSRHRGKLYLESCSSLQIYHTVMMMVENGSNQHVFFWNCWSCFWLEGG